MERRTAEKPESAIEVVDSLEEQAKERKDGDALEEQMAAMPAGEATQGEGIAGEATQGDGIEGKDSPTQAMALGSDDEALSQVYLESKRLAEEKSAKDRAEADKDLKETLEKSKKDAGGPRKRSISPGDPEAAHSWGSGPMKSPRPRRFALSLRGASPLRSPVEHSGSRQASLMGSPPPTQRSPSRSPPPLRRRSRSRSRAPPRSSAGSLPNISYETPEKAMAVKNCKVAHDKCSARVEASLGGGGSSRGCSID